MFAGMDYLTLWSDSSPDANKSFYQNATDWLVGVTPASHTIKAATLYGTKGYRSEGVYVGIGEERALLNVPGYLAQEAYCKLYNPSHRCTRIDIQVTSTHGYNPKEPKKPLWEWEERLATFKSGEKGRIPKPTYAGGRESGMTLYSGSASSDHYGRIYDKHVQSQDEQFRHMFRWEVVARRVWAEWLANRFLMLTDDEITSQIPELVASWWEKRGVMPPWGMSHTKLWRKPPRNPWDYEKSLKWVETAVSPTIERLRGYVSLKHIMAALGLDYNESLEYTAYSGGKLPPILDIGDETNGLRCRAGRED